MREGGSSAPEIHCSPRAQSIKLSTAGHTRLCIQRHPAQAHTRLGRHLCRLAHQHIGAIAGAVVWLAVPREP